MNLDQIIRLITRLFMRRGINAGINYAARRGKDPAEMTKEDKAQAQSVKTTAQRARKAGRLVRRIGRF